MDAKAIKKIINLAKSVGKEDSLVFRTDNNDYIYANNETSTAYYDETNNEVICLRTNANPIRSTMNQPKYEIYDIQPEHLTGITFQLDVKDVDKIIGDTDFDPDDVARVVKSFAPAAQATTSQRNKDGKFNEPESNRIKGVTLGILPPSPEIPDPNEGN